MEPPGEPHVGISAKEISPVVSDTSIFVVPVVSGALNPVLRRVETISQFFKIDTRSVEPFAKEAILEFVQVEGLTIVNKCAV